MEIDNIINRVEKRIELAIMISIFFPSLMNAFFSSFNNNVSELSKQSSPWFIMVGLYLLSYVTYQWLRKLNISGFIYKVLGFSTLLGIALFIAPTIFLAILVRGSIESSLAQLYFVLLKISIYGLPIVASISLTIILFGICWEMVVEFIKNKKS